MGERGLIVLCSLAAAVAGSGGWCENRLLPPLTLPEVRPRSAQPVLRNDDPTPDLIRKNGYPVEEHWTTTQDGYVLALHRIPHGRGADPDLRRPAILVQHGLLCSSADWVVSDPSKGLGYILADAGYDVWLGTFRGNTYSRNHTVLDPEHTRSGFWDFTWDEMAKYDLPSMIEYVLQVSGEEELFYAGHSMGTTAFMAMHHYRPDIGEKIRLANLLAPVAGEANMGGPLGWIADSILYGMLDFLMELMGVGEFLPSNLLIDCLATLFCHETITQGLCTNILFILCGFDEAQMNRTLLPDILHHTPAGASTYTVLHYAQEKHEHDGFHAYDWGKDQTNYQHHGTYDVPQYNLGDVTTPVALYWSDNDYFAMPGDILTTIMGLPNIVPGMNHEVEWEAFTHLDFLWGIDADKYVYNFVLENLRTCTETDCRNVK
jgi:lysosomal acid lipase/cholesteryl ester hydrolase